MIAHGRMKETKDVQESRIGETKGWLEMTEMKG